MPSYKLTYFNAKGRGEVARLLFAAAGKKYDDIRIEFSQWPELKPKTPQGSLPTLEVDGKVTICQSQAVNRCLARDFKLAGANSIEMAVVDQILDTILDMQLPFITISFTQDEEKKKTDMETFKNETVPKVLTFLEKLMVQTGTKNFAVGSWVTVADLALFATIELIGEAENLDKFPLLKKNRETVAALPKIKDYLAKRPETAF